MAFLCFLTSIFSVTFLDDEVKGWTAWGQPQS